MKKCTKCNIEINTHKLHCPLCYSELEGENDAHFNAPFATPTSHDKTYHSNNFLLKLFAFITLAIVVLTVSINLLVNPRVLWCLIVAAGLLYVWVLITHTILSRRSNLEKIFFQFLSILLVVFTTNEISGGNNWFWNYFTPSAALTTVTVLLFILLVNKKRSDFAFSFFIMSLLLIALSTTLILTHTDTFKLLNIINIIYSSLFATGIIIFGHKHLLRSLQKNFHI